MRWTRAAVGELIERECGIALKVRAVGNYLKRWGFTPQKPIKRAYEQRPEAVKAWIDEAFRRLRLVQRPKAARFSGATRRRWSTPTCVGAATRHRNPEIAKTDPRLLPRSTRQVRRIDTSSCQINSTAFRTHSVIDHRRKEVDISLLLVRHCGEV